MTTPGASAVDEGIRCLQQGDAVRAVALLGNAVQLDPGDARAFQYLGIARVQQGDVNGGINALREAARLLPTNSGIAYNLGIALNKAGETEEARRVLEKTLSLDPGNTKARAALDSIITSTQNQPPQVQSAHGTLSSMGMAGLGTVGGVSVPETQAPSPAPYAPPSMFTPPQSAGVPAAPQPALGTGGMQYTPPSTVHPNQFSREPTTAERLARGLGWGAVYGQWWTLLNIIWIVLIYGIFAGKMSAGFGLFLSIVMAVVFAFTGSIIGLIIGAINAEVGVGAGIGIVGGVVFLGLEVLATHNPFSLINAFFWFFTGRFVGAGIAAKVQARVEN